MFGKKFEDLQKQLNAITSALAAAGFDAAALLADPAAYGASVKSPADAEKLAGALATVASQTEHIAMLQAESAAMAEGLKLAGVSLPASPKASDVQSAITAAIEQAAVKKAAAQVAASGHEPLPVAGSDEPTGRATKAELFAEFNSITDPLKRAAYYKRNADAMLN